MLGWIALALAQAPVEPGRAEIAVSGSDKWDVLPLGSDGLVLVGRQAHGDRIEVRQYDAAFAQRWVATTDPDDRVREPALAASDHAVWIASAGRDRVDLIGFDRADGHRTALTVDVDGAWARVDALDADDDHAWIVLTTSRRKASAVLVDLHTGAARVLDVAKRVGDAKARVDGLTLGPEEGERSIGARADHGGHRSLWVIQVDADGLGTPIALAPPGDQNLLSAGLVPVDEARGLILGTYATGQADRLAQGLFVCGVDGGAVTWTRYHDFASFDHFFDYLPPRGQRAAEARVARNGGNVELSYLFRPLRALALPDRTVVFAEAYRPEFVTTYQTRTTTVNGVTQTQMVPVTVFVGYRYTHAIAVAFDLRGERLWDASMPIGNVLLPTPRPLVSAVPGPGTMTLLYTTKGKVYSVVADATGLTGERGEQRLGEDDESGEEVKTALDAHSAWWYGDRFLVWGLERRKAADGSRRSVFTFRALAPEPPAAIPLAPEP